MSNRDREADRLADDLGLTRRERRRLKRTGSLTEADRIGRGGFEVVMRPVAGSRPTPPARR